ncbi:unnamed protein product, partial [Acanthoscelides obtectus]
MDSHSAASNNKAEARSNVTTRGDTRRNNTGNTSQRMQTRMAENFTATASKNNSGGSPSPTSPHGRGGRPANNCPCGRSFTTLKGLQNHLRRCPQ